MHSSPRLTTPAHQQRHRQAGILAPLSSGMLLLPARRAGQEYGVLCACPLVAWPFMAGRLNRLASWCVAAALVERGAVLRNTLGVHLRRYSPLPVPVLPRTAVRVVPGPMLRAGCGV